MISSTSLVLFLSLLIPQEAQQEAQQGGAEKPKPAQEGEQGEQETTTFEIKFPESWPSTGGTSRRIAQIKEYRKGSDGCEYVTRLEDRHLLDLSNVDFDADVVARINGHDVTRSEFLLWHGLYAGLNGVTTNQLKILVDDAVKKIVADDGDPKRFEVTDEEVEAKIREEDEAARAQGEEALKFYKERVESTLGWDQYRVFVRNHVASEKLLLPRIIAAGTGPAAMEQGLPLESVELLQDQQNLLAFLNDSYLKGEPLPDMFRNQFLKMLQQSMIQAADIRLALEHDLPEGVFMTVNGTPVQVDEVLRYASSEEKTKQEALQLCLLYRAIDDALESAGATISYEEFKPLFEAHEAEFVGTLFPLASVAAMRGFYSLDEYKEYFRRRTAFERMLSDEVTDDVLKAHHAAAGKLFYESGKVDCDIFWVSLIETESRFDLKGPAAWKKARERIDGAYKALSEGQPVDQIREEFCSPNKDFDVEAKPHVRNELRQLLGESEYQILRDGYSIADDVFYNRVEGDVVGPYRITSAQQPGMRERYGYVLIRVKAFATTAEAKPFDVQKPFVKSDYHDLRLYHFGHECLKNADLEITRREE